MRSKRMGFGTTGGIGLELINLALKSVALLVQPTYALILLGRLSFRQVICTDYTRQ